MNSGLRFIFGLVIIAFLAMGGWKLWNYWGTFKPQDSGATASAQPDIPGDSLPGMPQSLEPVLTAARQRGAAGLHDFLKMYSNTINDPRRASIELDYVVLLAQSSPGEARQEFAKVKTRVPPNSPVYNRVKQLEKTYD